MTDSGELDQSTIPGVHSPLARKVLGLVGGTTLGLVAIGAIGVLIAGSALIPMPVVGSGLGSKVVTPVATDRLRVCPGPIVRLGEVSGEDANVAITVGSPELIRDSTIGKVEEESLRPAGNASNIPAKLLRLKPQASGEIGLVSGSQSQLASEPDLVGFAAASCVKQSSDTWLVGGATTTGRTSLLLLTNPSSVDSEVSVEVYSERGLEDVSSGNQILVPAGSQEVLSIAGLASGLASPVVHVSSEGGRVTAQLQESIVRTLTPGGVDVFTGSVAPSTSLVIPGVVIADPEAVESMSGVPDFEDLAGILRILIPESSAGQADSTVKMVVSAIPETEDSTPSSATFSIEAGKVTDLPLATFAPGSYTFKVKTDLPAVAAVRTSTVTLEDSAADGSAADGTDDQPPVAAALDFAWFAAAPELTEDTLISVAPGPGAMLHLANTGSDSAVVTIDAREGAGNTLTIPAGAAIAVPVTDGMSYALAGYSKLRASVSYQGNGALAGFVIQSQSRQSNFVSVYLG